MTVIQQTDRVTSGGTGMAGTAKLVWSSTGAVNYKPGDQTITLKGKGSVAAVASGKVVAGCSGGTDMNLSMSYNGVATTQVLTFSTTGKAGVFTVSTPSAYWEGKDAVKQACGAEITTAYYGDRFYSSSRTAMFVKRASATSQLVLGGTIRSKIETGNSTQTVMFSIWCTDLKACAAAGGRGVTKPKKTPVYFDYKAKPLGLTCVDGPLGTRRVVVDTEMYVANTGPKSVTDVKGATQWAKTMRVKVRLIPTTTGLNFTRPWKSATTGNLQQFTFYREKLKAITDNVDPEKDWQVEVEYIWDRPQPVPDIVVKKKYATPACF